MVKQSACVLAHSDCVVTHSDYVLPHSAYVLRHSVYVLQHSACVVRHSACVVRHCVCVLTHCAYVLTHGANEKPHIVHKYRRLLICCAEACINRAFLGTKGHKKSCRIGSFFYTLSPLFQSRIKATGSDQLPSVLEVFPR